MTLVKSSDLITMSDEDLAVYCPTGLIEWILRPSPGLAAQRMKQQWISVPQPFGILMVISKAQSHQSPQGFERSLVVAGTYFQEDSYNKKAKA